MQLFKNTFFFKFIIFLITSFSLTACTSTKNEPTSNINTQTSSQTQISLTPFDQNTLDGILVSFGDEVILLSDLQHAILMASNSETHLLATGQLMGKNLTPPKAEQILNDLINQKVLQTKAQDLGFEIKEDELSQRINDFLKQQGFSESDLEVQLQHDGKSMDEYRAEFKKELLKQQVIGRIIAPMVTVTESEVNNYYLQQSKNVKQVSAVKLRSLVLNLPSESANVDTASLLNAPLIKTVREKIAGGTPFVELVKKYSMATNAAQTEGLLSPRPVSELPPALRDQLTHLEVNQVAGPFLIGSSAFFFQYLGAEYAVNSDLQKNFGNWKAKLQNIKFGERLVQYLNTEKEKLNMNSRPFKIY